jgi:chemotaxis methyl-accepting protein methylase
MGNGTEVTGTKLDQNITDNLVKALVDDRVKSFDDYLTFLKKNDKKAYNEMNQILSDFKINETDNLNTMWV